MKVLVQRVRQASVSVEGREVSAIGAGLLLLVGIAQDDTEQDMQYLLRKTLALRIFNDENGVMNRSVQDVGAQILAVSQFTLMADTRKGNRPSYIAAARPELAKPYFDRFVQALSAGLGQPVPTGVFGADMQVSLINDGPVTISLDSRDR
ncbi:D-aminoacyl-tRNA deacylase [Advenella mimigardefordensis]|uniref:D-aminoacyl-tRNA deacylase n=1 Tax=Advenella mimigardefordensis (strain DSM 17166 / LMG 22922 / DPN7) TaxID=1247726 RepID=W0PD65_ADVMD|nr:D-aminoacyl-tRNA deacylase [Advenella mimigardefordensis]AHG64814.1 D-tyrosyl-tRNA(Tyr) deacylase [Advenella mimigardefordensis DPN7]